MRMQFTVLRRGPGGRPAAVTEVEVDALPGSTADQLAGALGASLTGHRGTARWRICIGGAAVDADAPVGRGVLLDGAALSLDRDPAEPTPPRRSIPRTPLSLAVTHGPDSGRTVELVPGVHTVGRGAEAAIVIDDPSISRVHATVTVTADAISIADVGSTNGTELDGARVGVEPVEAHVGDTIRVGDTLVALRAGNGVPAALEARGDGTLGVARRPRVQGPPPPQSISLPSPPPRPHPAPLPWVAMLLPLPIAGVMALLFGPMMLAFAVMSPVLMAGSVLGDRLSGRRRHAAEQAAYLRRLGHAEREVGAACREEAERLARTLPDPARTLVTATTPTAEVWERRLTDPDTLSVSIGWCDAPASFRVERHAETGTAEHPVLHRVPCAVPLAEVGVIGLCGERGRVLGVLRAALGQLVSLHSPLDLELVLVAGTGPADVAWSWLGRLPHVRTADGHPRPGWLLGLGRTDESRTDDARAGVAALAAVVRQRLADEREDTGVWAGPRTLLLLDGAAALRGLPDLAVLLEHGPRVGICVIAVDLDRGGLPSQARAVLDLTDPAAPMLHLPGAAPAPLVVDQVGPWWADRLSRGLARLRDVTPGPAVSSLPTRVGLLDVLGVDRPEAMSTKLVHAWSRTVPGCSVPIGHTAEGMLRIDLAADGPHALVAGTTGAGKSELLRTLVASLAVHHSPARLTMVLIDYKGGAAFRDCAPLPHVAAVVTDLDEHLAARALVSLRAELKRRERVLAAAGMTDFLAYQSSAASTETPLPRLVIVIDEFRALAEELPEFIDGMVAVAALGRSLGVHLVLATQRPAGVVTADIKANLNLRIGLRLRDRSDSVDVLDAPAAASLDPHSPGRALVRVAGGPVVAFQAAHASARTGAASSAGGPDGIRVRQLPWGESPAQWRDSPDDVGGAPTDLCVVVAAATEAAALVGAQPAESPWLPALPERIEAQSLPRATPGRFPIGLADQPAQLRQPPLEVSLDEPGHWGFVGGAGSGRSTALLTLASAAASECGPGDLHVYAVSTGSLATLQSLPHCGAHVVADDVPHLDRLVARLAAELVRRRAALTASGHPAMAEWRRANPATAPPALLVLVDDWDLLVQRADDHSGGQVLAALLGVLRDGAGLGLTAALAGDRALLVGRAVSAVTHRVLLRLADPTDLLLAGISPRSVPAHQPPGRGLLPDGTEVQIAQPLPWPTEDRASHPRPWRVDALPDRVSKESLPPTDRSDDLVMVGVGGDELAPRGLSPERDGRRWAVIGAGGAGISTALSTITTGLVAAGRPLCVVASSSGPWGPLRRDPRIHWCDDAGRLDDLVALRRRTPDLAVVVDDSDRLVDTPLDAALREMAALVDRDGGLIVVGAKAEAVSVQYRGLAVAVVRHRTGILLGPADRTAADVLGVRVPVDRQAPPGRGYLVRAGALLPVQVASTTVR